MSVRISAQVWGLELDPVAKLVLLKLADCADDSGSNAYPSISRLATEVGVSERTIQRHLRDLTANGVIEVVAQAHRYRPTNYRIQPDRGVKLAPLSDGRGDIRDMAGVTNGASRGDTAVAPDPSYEPSIDPSIAATQRRRGRRPEVIAPKAIVPLTETALAELRDRFGERLQDFDEVIDFWRGDQRFRVQADKPAFLAKKLEEQAQREAERSSSHGSHRGRVANLQAARGPSAIDEFRALGLVVE